MKEHLIFIVVFIFLSSCGDKDVKSQDAENSDGLTDDFTEIDESADIENDEPGENDEDEVEPLEIVPGVGIGSVEVGMKYSEVKNLIGTPDSEMGFNRLVTADYKTLSFELVFTSPDLMVLKDDAVLIAIGAKAGGSFLGSIIPGMTRDEVEKVFTGEKEDTGDYVFYPEGFSVQYENNISVLIGVFPPYKLAYAPPEMVNCNTSKE
jgi:hypothetical protein